MTIRIVFLAVGFFGLALTGLAEGPCASTPAAAVKAFESGAAVEDVPGGYRVTGLRNDPVLGTNWAHVGRCGHPEWPGTSLATRGGGGTTVTPSGVRVALVKVVRAGDTVRLWRHETNLRMELAAVSEEAGGLGDRIRLRVASRQADGETLRYVFGLVRGPADVEME